jgi:site-specific recombinase XerD
MTKEEIFERLQTEITIRGLSPGTYNTYMRAIDLFLNWSDKPFEKLEEVDFRNYLLYLINRGNLSTATINMYNAAIRFFLQVILEKDVNYRRTARLRKEYKLPPVWSIEEVAKFLNVIDNIRDRAIFINIYGSGLRVSEISTLKIQDVDSKNMRLLIRQSKGRKDRYTILSKSGLDALRDYWRRYRPVSPEGYLFPGITKEGHLGKSGIEFAFRKYLRRTDISTPGTVHTLRHCFATHALEAGTDILYIKELLGHSCFETTNVYLHIANTKVFKTSSPVDSLIL